MGSALTDDDPFNTCFAAGAGLSRAAKYFQLIPVAALAVGHRIKIGLAGSQRSTEIFKAPF